MSRRALIVGFALVGTWASLCMPTVSYSQQSTLPRRIGVISVSFSSETSEGQAFRQGLEDAGYVEGRNAQIEWRSAQGDYDRVPQLAADLIQRKVEVIVVQSTRAVQAVMRTTSTIPIVIATAADPVGSGLVANLAHPGGNVTGLSTMVAELSAKRLELLKETIPQVVRVTVLSNPDTPYSARVIEELKVAAASLSIELSFVFARTLGELAPDFSVATRSHAQAMYVIDDAFFVNNRVKLVELASKAHLPTIYGFRPFVDAGGLISYGASYRDQFRRAAGYVDKILRGAKPGDLPIEQPTKFELVINLKTARSLGVTIPRAILLQADEVIR